MRSRIWIIIPVYNRKSLTRACLEGLRCQQYRAFQVIVVDDGSTDGTSQMLRNEFPDVLVLKGDGNLFWTKSVNLGVKYVLSHANAEDYILTLNDDLTVKVDYLERLWEGSQLNPNAMIGSIAIDTQDTTRVVSGGVLINWFWAHFFDRARGWPYAEILKRFPSLARVDALPGRGTLIPLKIFHDIGMYNEKQLPHYGADYEFSIRAKNKGYTLLINHLAPIFMHEEETGLNNVLRRLCRGEFIQNFFSIKSPNHLRYRWNFARLCCPWYGVMWFYFIDVIRVVLGSFKTRVVLRILK